jgi:predicted neutral ceramidase superfamily lipid hydrolase
LKYRRKRKSIKEEENNTFQILSVVLSIVLIFFILLSLSYRKRVKNLEKARESYIEEIDFNTKTINHCIEQNKELRMNFEQITEDIKNNAIRCEFNGIPMKECLL